MRDILRQIWRFLRIAASGPGSLLSLLFVGIVVACELTGIQITLRLIQWSADFYNALQKLDAPAAVKQIGVFAMLIGTSAMLFLIGQYLRKIVQLRWRRRLTDVLLASWTANQAYWILDPSLGSSRAVDNPDQRISEDANIFVASMLGGEGVRTGVLNFTINLIGLASYATLLWQLSTFDLSFALLGYDFNDSEVHVLDRAGLCGDRHRPHPRARTRAAGPARRRTEARGRLSLRLDAHPREFLGDRTLGWRGRRAAHPVGAVREHRRHLAIA